MGDARHLHVGRGLHVNLETGAVYRGDLLVAQLSPQEVAFVQLLVEREGRLVSEQDLHDALWTGEPLEYEADFKRLKQRVYKLTRSIRRKLDDDELICIVRGAGISWDEGALRGPLPAPPAPNLLGRDDDLARVRAALSEARVVLLRGPGGVGKTALAHALLATWDDVDAPRALLCDLSEVEESSELVRVVADALETPLQGATLEQAVGVVGGALEALRGLLVLDNIEQLPQTVVDVIRDWLQAAPQLRVLATSRFEVELPEMLALPLAALTPDDALRLLTEGRPDDDEAALRAIAAHLDHLPLALRMARSYLGEPYSAAELLRSIQRGELPRQGADAPDRQANLAATVAWSWALLSAPEREALTRAAVLQGSFDLDAFASVASPAGGAQELLRRLFQKSLLDRAEGTAHGRYRLYEVVRWYARARLAEHPEHQAIWQAHLDWFVSRFEALAGEGTGTDTLAAMRADFENARAALRFGVQAEPDTAARLLDLMDDLLVAAGLGDVHVRMADALLDQEARLAPEQVVRVLLSRGRAFRRSGEARMAEDDLQEAAQRAEQHGLQAALSDVRRAQGVLSITEQRYADAEAQLRSAIQLAARSAHGHRGRCHLNLALVLRHQGQMASAQRHLEQALEHAVRGDDALCRSRALGTLATLFAHQGRPEEAARVHARSLELARELGDLTAEANALCNLAMLALGEGQHPEAEAQLSASLAINERLGHRAAAGLVQGNLALLELDRREHEAARRWLIEAESRHALSSQAHLLAIDALHRCLLHLDLGEHEAAAHAARRGAALAKDRRTRAHAALYRSAALWCAGRAEDAQAALGPAEAALRELGDTDAIGICEDLQAAMAGALPEAARRSKTVEGRVIGRVLRRAWGGVRR